MDNLAKSIIIQLYNFLVNFTKTREFFSISEKAFCINYWRGLQKMCNVTLFYTTV